MIDGRTESAAAKAPLSRGAGEIAAGHDRKVEESPATLANEGMSLTSLDLGASSGAAADSVVPWIVRASMPLRVDWSRFPDGPSVGAARLALAKARRLAALGANAVVRELWRQDGAALDRWLAQHGELPRSKDWPPSKINSYGLVRRVVPELDSGIASAVAKMASDKWRQDRWEALIRQEKRPPHFSARGAFPVREQELRGKIVRDDRGRWAISVRLFSGTGEGRWVTLPLMVRDGRAEQLLARLLDGTWRLGAAKLQEDKRRPGRWYVRLAYKRRPEDFESGRDAAINRGIRCFLAGVTGGGAEWLYDGADIVAHLAQIQRRRREYQRDSKASGRWGHGRTRTLKPVEALQGKGERWRATKCHVIAARFVDWLAHEGVSRLYVEDFTGIRAGAPEERPGGERVYQLVQEWPYYQLEQRVREKCELRGIEVVSVEAKYISQTCPQCGRVDATNRDLARWRLRCECGYRRHLDMAAAANVLARGRERLGGAKPPPEQSRGHGRCGKSADRRRSQMASDVVVGAGDSAGAVAEAKGVERG